MGSWTKYWGRDTFIYRHVWADTSCFLHYYRVPTLNWSIWGAAVFVLDTPLSLNPSQAINPAHLRSAGIQYSLHLPANSPLCISFFFLHPPQDIKATLSCRTRTKEAASAQRNPLKCKTTEETVDRQAARRKDRQSWKTSLAAKQINR